MLALKKKQILFEEDCIEIVYENGERSKIPLEKKEVCEEINRLPGVIAATLYKKDTEQLLNIADEWYAAFSQLLFFWWAMGRPQLPAPWNVSEEDKDKYPEYKKFTNP